jgi:hypothetical protein
MHLDLFKNALGTYFIKEKIEFTKRRQVAVDDRLPLDTTAPQSLQRGCNLVIVYFHLKSKIFQDSPSYRIFRRMHGILNINKIKN